MELIFLGVLLGTSLPLVGGRPAATIARVGEVAIPVLLSEGFEGGVMPPAGWETVGLNPDYTWQITADSLTGSHAARVPPDPNEFRPQGEALISPILDLTQGSVSFWSKGDLHWCRDVLDNCDLLVWVVIGDFGGDDDVVVGKADDDWLATEVWSLSQMDLTPFLPPPPATARIAFEYLGWDHRAGISLDQIEILGDSIPIFTDGFESGDTVAWSDTIP